MRKPLRPLAMFACISAATAFGANLALADTAAPPSGKQMQKCGEQRRHHEGRRGHFLKRLAKELGLSDQQKSQAKAILQQSREQNKPYFKELMAQKHQMRELTLSGSADEAAIRAQSAKVAAAEADLAVMRAKEAKQLLALLTPDQTAKLKTILDKREQKFRKFMSGDEAPLR